MARLPSSDVLCRCDCGEEGVYRVGNLNAGRTKSCGCLLRDDNTKRFFLHGMIQHPAHRSWSGIKNRCTNKEDQDFHLYGGRGITFSDRWLEFNRFWADMGPTWFVGATIERIDGSGNYEPSNCEWRTIQEQQRNRANNVMLETPHGVLIATEYAEKIGMAPSALHSKIRRGWTNGGAIKCLGTRAEYEKWDNPPSPKAARDTKSDIHVDTPWGSLTIAEAAVKVGISEPTMRWRISSKWPSERMFVGKQGKGGARKKCESL